MCDICRKHRHKGATMKNIMAFIASCGACLALVGCASEQPRFTGFLSDYSVLTPHPTIPGALVYRNPNIDPKEYEAVLIDPVEVRCMNGNGDNRAAPEDIAAFRRFVREELTAAIGKHTAIVTEPGPRVLRCRLQVTLRPTGSIDTPLRPWLPREYALGTANIEADAHDPISGELVAAYVSPRDGAEWYTTFFLTSSPDPWEAARAVARTRIATIGDLYSDRAIDRGSFDVANHGE
jgi:hypothetical protein